MEIRYITPVDDRMAISKVYEESWKYAYKGIVPQDYLDSIPEGGWATGLGDPKRKTLVYTDKGRIIGTSSFCESRFDKFSGQGEIISIYLLPEYMGKGYGKNLLEEVVEELKRLGYQNIFLWVLEDNIRARRFYEKQGFSLTEDFLDDNIGGKKLREVRYVYRKFTRTN